MDLTSDLIETLECLIKMYRGLLDLVRKEKDLLIAVNLNELNDSNMLKEQMLSKIRLQEQVRLRIARDLAHSLGADAESPRLLDIANLLADADADRLRNLHSTLDLLLRRVSTLNKENELLAQSALDNVNGAMDSIRESLQDKVTYERKGALQSQNATGGQLIRREV